MIPAMIWDLSRMGGTALRTQVPPKEGHPTEGRAPASPNIDFDHRRQRTTPSVGWMMGTATRHRIVISHPSVNDDSNQSVR